MNAPDLHPIVVLLTTLSLVGLISFVVVLRQQRRDPGKGLIPDLSKGLVLATFSSAVAILGAFLNSRAESGPDSPAEPIPRQVTETKGIDPISEIRAPPGAVGTTRTVRPQALGWCGDLEIAEHDSEANSTGAESLADVRVHVDGSLSRPERDYLRARLTALLGRYGDLGGAGVQVTSPGIEERRSAVPTAYVTLDWTLQAPSGQSYSSTEGTSGRGSTMERARLNALACAAAEVASNIRARTTPGA